MQKTDHSNGWAVKLYRMRPHAEEWELVQTKDPLRVELRPSAIVFPSIKYRIRWHSNDVNTNVTITRRHEHLSVSLLLPQHPPPTLRCLILKFESTEDCITFCDKLQELNVPSDRNIDDDDSSHVLLADPQETVADVARLLASDDMMEFVDNLEQALLSCPEGVELLDSLVDPVGETDDDAL